MPTFDEMKQRGQRLRALSSLGFAVAVLASAVLVLVKILGVPMGWLMILVPLLVYFIARGVSVMVYGLQAGKVVAEAYRERHGDR